MVYVDFGKEIKKKVMQEPKEVQFNIENTTNQPVTIDLFDASSLTPISSSSNFSTSSSPSNTSGLGSEFNYVVYNETTNLINVTFGNNLQVGFFNPVTQTFISSIVTNTYSVPSINFNPAQTTTSSLSGYIYCADDDTTVVRVIDTTNYEIVQRIEVTNFNDYIFYCNYNQKVYVLNANFFYDVSVIDTTTNTALSDINLSSLPNISSLGFITFNPNNNQIYITPSNGGTYVYIIDADTDAISESDLGIPDTKSNCIVVNPNNNRLYFETTDGLVTNISVFDCNTNTFLTNIEIINSVSQNSNDYGVYCPINNCVYFYNINTDSVFVIDCSNNTLVDTIIITSSNSVLYGIVYSSIDNCVYIPTATTFNILNGFQKIDCLNNSLSTITLNINSQNLTNSAQNTLNGNLYVYSETQSIVTVYDSSGNFITNINNIGTNGNGNRKAIIYIEFYDTIIVLTDLGIYYIGCITNTEYQFYNFATSLSNYNYNLKYDELSGLLYIFSDNNIVKKITLFTSPYNQNEVTILNYQDVQPTSLITKNNEIYSNFKNKNFLQIVEDSINDSVKNLIPINGNIYGLNLYTNNIIFRYNVSNSYFDRNEFLTDYQFINFNYSGSNDKIYGIAIKGLFASAFLYEMNSSTLLVERSFPLSQFQNTGGDFRICFPIAEKNILIVTSAYKIFIFDIQTLILIQEIDYFTLGYTNSISSVSYSSVDEKIIFSNGLGGTYHYFFVDANSYSLSVQYNFVTFVTSLNYCVLNNKFYGTSGNDIIVIDSSTELIDTTIVSSNNFLVTASFSNNNIFNPNNNLIYVVGDNGVNGTIDYINPLTNTIIYTDILLDFSYLDCVTYDVVSNSVFVSGRSLIGANIFQISSVNPLVTTPIYTPITTLSKVLDNTSQGMTTSSLNGYTYISSNFQNYISVFNETNQLITEISIASPKFLLYVESLDYVYVLQTTNEISIIDCTNNSIITTSVTLSTPQNLCYNNFDNKIYVSCDFELVRFDNDLSSSTIYTYVSVVSNSAIALDNINNNLYISGSFNDTLYVFDCDSLIFLSDLIIPSFEISNPNLIYNENNGYLYTFSSNSALNIIDISTSSLVLNNEFTGDTAYSNYNLYSSVLTNDNYLVFSYNNNDLFYLLFFNCYSNLFEYSRIIENVCSSTNLNTIGSLTGYPNGITFSSFDNSLRLLSGNDVGSSQGNNLLSLSTISKQQTLYNFLAIGVNNQITLCQNDTSFITGTGTNGGNIVTSNVLSDDSLYYGGSFSEWNGNTCGNIVRVLNNGSYDSTFVTGTGFSSQVNVIKRQSDNKIICGGNSTSYNGVSINNIARINTDGSLDTTFIQGTGFNAEVRDILIQSNGKIIVAGDFTSYNGNSCNYIARLNSDGSFDSTFNIGTGFNTYLSTISFQSDEKIICGGGLTSFNGNTCNYIARLNSDGSFDSTFNIGTGFDNTVNKTFVKTDNKIVVSGTFIDFNGNTIFRYVQLNSDGSFDINFNLYTGSGHIDNAIFDIYEDSYGIIFLVGNFTTFNFAGGYNGFVALFQNGLINTFYDISLISAGDKFSISKNVDDSKLYLSGTSYNDRIYNFYTYENISLNQKYSFGNFIGDIKSSLENNNKLLVVGNFNQYINTPVNGLLQLNLDGSIDENFNNFLFTSFSDVLCCVFQLDGKILLGGAFTDYDGNTISNIVRINSDGSYDSTFITGTGFDNTVRTISVQSDGKIICGGDFTDIDGNSVLFLARLNSDGSYDSTFNIGSGLDSACYTSVIQSDGKIILGGNFNNFNGNSVNNIVRLESDGSYDSTFITGLDGFGALIFKLKIYNDKIYVVGTFDTYQENLINIFGNLENIVRLNSDGSYDSSFSTFNSGGTGLNGVVTDIYELNDGNLMVCGQFGTYVGVPSERFAVIKNDGSVYKLVGTYGFDSLVSSLIQINGDIYVGGGFTEFNLISNQNGLTRLNYDGNYLNTIYEIDPISIIYWSELDNLTSLNVPVNYYSFLNNNFFGNTFFNVINNYLYVSYTNSNLLQVLDPSNNYILISSLNLTLNGNIIGFALNPENNILAIAVSTLSTNTLSGGQYYTPNFGLNTSGSLILLNSENNTISQTLSTLNNYGIIFINYSPISGNFVYGGSQYSSSPSTYLSFATPSSTYTISGGSVNYNFFVQSLNNDPKKIEEIELVMPQTYLAKPVNVQYTDASGISNFNPFLPNIEIDTFQKATNRAKIKFGDEYIMNINTKIVDFVLPPLSTTILVITYQELLKSDMLDAVVYADELKAKYKINQDANSGVITAEKYWGAKKMPKKLSLGKDWLADMKQKFAKVEVLEYDLPKLAGGTANTRQVYADLFGFKKQVKKKHISILKTKKKKVKFKKNVDVKLATKKQSIKPKPKAKSSLEIFTDLIKSTIKSKNIEVKEIKNSLPIKNKKGVLLGVKDKNSNHSIYLIKPNADRFTAVRFIGDTDVKIELKNDWLKDISGKFNEVMILELNKK